MAVFGHSGSLAPQLMHSLVIIVAMGMHEYHPADRPFNDGWRAPRGRCRDGQMRRFALLALLLAAPFTAFGEEHAEMRAALREIETARKHLESAKHDYRGHRPTAVEELRQAEEQIRKGIEKAGGAKEER